MRRAWGFGAATTTASVTTTSGDGARGRGRGGGDDYAGSIARRAVTRAARGMTVGGEGWAIERSA